MSRVRIAAAVAALLSAFVRAPVVPRQAIPVRTVAVMASTDSAMFSGSFLSQIHGLASGSVVVNDQGHQRLLMLDSTLKHMTRLADTAAGTPNPYPVQSGGMLVPFMGDTSVFVDPQSQALIVVSPAGKFGRVMAPPNAQDVYNLSRSGSAFDPKGRVVYRSSRRSASGAGRGDVAFPASPGRVVTMQPDSAPIMRGDFDARSTDTIAMMHTGVAKGVLVTLEGNRRFGLSATNPLPVTDEFAMLPDGTIAIVRGQDYHIDWLSMDGKMTSTPKMPFDWKPISSDDKRMILDSLKYADSVRKAAMKPPPPPPPGSLAPINFAQFPFVSVDAAELPDYYPPIRSGQVKADPEGNLWILPSTSTLSSGTLFNTGTTTPAPVGLVYDIVNRKGEVFERVRLPDGRTLLGFAPGGVVYMMYAPGAGKLFLERGRVVQ